MRLHFIYWLPVSALVQIVVCKAATSTCTIWTRASDVIADCNSLGLSLFPSVLPDDVTHIFLSQNKLSDVTSGGPVSRYRGLRMLDLSHNLLVRVDWQFLPDSLQELHLSHNNITNICSDNRGVTSFSRPQLPGLRVLRVGHNLVDTLQADCFSGLSSLEILDMSGNNIRELRNNTFSDLSSLISLDLSGNLIGFLELGALSWLPRLLELSLRNNQLNSSGLPPGVFKNVGTTLTTLYLNSNQMGYDRKYPEKAMTDLTSVETLHIDTFPFYGDEPIFGPGFSSLKNLKELALDQDWDADHARGLNQLSNNTFAAFANTSLQSLSMTNRGFPLERVEACAFCPLRRLASLGLDHMNTVLPSLDDLLSTFQAFTHINREFLSIRAPEFVKWKGRATGVHLTAEAMKYVHQMCLRELVLSKNYIVAIETHALGRNDTRFTECIEKIDFSQNLLINIESNFFFSLSSYRHLRSVEFQLQNTFNFERAMIMLSRHPKKEKSDKLDINLTVAVPPALELFNVSGFTSNFGYLPRHATFLDADKLTTVDLSFNRFINCWPMLGLEKLQNLNLSGSDCQIISLQTFDHYPSLKTLTLQRMNFSPLFLAYNGTRLFKNLRSLEIVDLSFNQLAILSPDMLMQQFSLRQLILLGNEFENLKFDLSGLANLTFLDLSNNRLSILSSAEQTMLDRLVARQQVPLRLHLQGNPLLCTCSTLHFVRWLGDTRVVLDREGDYPCLTDSGQLSSTRTVGREWLHAWRGCVGPTVLWAAVAGMLVLLSLMGAVWGLAKNITRLRFVYTVIRRIKMPKRTDFHRDAYVAYCDADTDFVCGRLKRQLQGRRGVRLLIKDLPVDAAETRFYQLPGDNVALKMLEHIDLCWKVILILTSALTRDSMVGFMTRAVLQSITDRMPHRVLLLCVGMKEVPEVTSLKALLEAVPEHQVFFLPQLGADSHRVWDSIAEIILQ